MRSKRNCIIQSQTGAALLAFILLLLVSSTYILAKQLNQRDYSPIRNQTTLDALATAKEALIAYAVTYYENNPGEFGFLPCPSTGAALSEGSSDGNCGVRDTNRLGKFPWKSLELPPLKDGSGECLWYAVSGAYKNNIPAAKTQMLNDDTRGAFRVFRPDGITIQYGNNPSERVVAVVIAPGDAINNQNRSPLGAGVEQCGGNYAALNYLDTFNGINNSIIGAANAVEDMINFADISGGRDTDNDGLIDGNDIIITITADEVWDAVKKRSDFSAKLCDNSNPNNLTLKIAECLASYSNDNAVNDGIDDPPDLNVNRSLPLPAPIPLADYRDNLNYSDRNTGIFLRGRLPIFIDDTDNIIYQGGACAGTVTNCTSPTAPFGNNLMSYCHNVWTNAFTPALGPTQAAAQADELMTLWQHWKDHLFYAVSQVFQPQALATDTSYCGNGQFCITTGFNITTGLNVDWGAIVFFSGEVVANPVPGPGTAVAQSRDTNTVVLTDTEQKNNIDNYLEGVNRTDYDNGSNTVYYDNNAPLSPGEEFNDVLYCIQDDEGGEGVPAFLAAVCPPP